MDTAKPLQASWTATTAQRPERSPGFLVSRRTADLGGAQGPGQMRGGENASHRALGARSTHYRARHPFCFLCLFRSLNNRTDSAAAGYQSREQ